MTDDERAARDWLERAYVDGDVDDEVYRATILRLLDRPVLPRIGDIPASVIDEMWMAAGENGNGKWGMICALHILHAHLTAPPPKLNPVLACEDALKEAEFDNGYYPERFIKALAAHGYKLVEAADDQ